MITPKELFRLINPIAPVESAMEGDPCGLLIDTGNESEGILVTLDCTPEAVEEAKKLGCSIIVTHHPVIYHPLRILTPDTPAGVAVLGGMSVISLHTCWDKAEGGINDILAQKLGLKNVRHFGEVGRMGDTENEVTPRELAQLAMKAFGAAHASVVEGNKPIKAVALVGGGGGCEMGYIPDSGAQAFITGELAHHELLSAKAMGITAITLGHFETEALAGQYLTERIAEVIGDRAKVYFSKTETPPNYHILLQ